MLPEYFWCGTPDQRNPAIDMRPAVGFGNQVSSLSFKVHPVRSVFINCEKFNILRLQQSQKKLILY